MSTPRPAQCSQGRQRPQGPASGTRLQRQLELGSSGRRHRMGWTLGVLPVAPDLPSAHIAPTSGPPPDPPPRPRQSFNTCCSSSTNPNTHRLHVCPPDSETEASPAHVASLGPMEHLHKIRVSCMKLKGVRWTSGRVCLSKRTKNGVRGGFLRNLPEEQEGRQHRGDPRGNSLLVFRLSFF